MAGIVFAGVAPHGWPIIPDLSEDALGALATRAALEELGRRAATARPDVIVVATPHNLVVEGAICLAAVARGAGTLHHEGRTVEMNLPVDAPLTDAIAHAARQRGLPITLGGYAGNMRAESIVPLDWGTMVPLWLLGHGRNLVGYGNVLAPDPEEDPGPPVVIVTPSRLLPRTAMVAFGEAVTDAAGQDGRRVAFVAFVASCDWFHTHEGGRYGVHPAAAEVDAAVLAALRANDPGRLSDLDEQQVEDAAIDGLWQVLMLAGVMNRTQMRGDVLSYEAPDAYATGMIVATFESNRDRNPA